MPPKELREKLKPKTRKNRNKPRLSRQFPKVSTYVNKMLPSVCILYSEMHILNLTSFTLRLLILSKYKKLKLKTHRIRTKEAKIDQEREACEEA